MKLTPEARAVRLRPWTCPDDLSEMETPMSTTTPGTKKRCVKCLLLVPVTHETNGEECRDFQWERLEKMRDDG